jgi:hypothetical protein
MMPNENTLPIVGMTALDNKLYNEVGNISWLDLRAIGNGNVCTCLSATSDIIRNRFGGEFGNVIPARMLIKVMTKT